MISHAWQNDLLLHDYVKRDEGNVPRKHVSALLDDQQSKISASATPARAEMLQAERERVIELYRSAFSAYVLSFERHEISICVDSLSPSIVQCAIVITLRRMQKKREAHHARLHPQHDPEDDLE